MRDERQTVPVGLAAWWSLLLAVPCWAQAPAGPEPRAGGTFAAAAAAAPGVGGLGVSARDRQERAPDVIFVPTPQPVVDKMLELADVRKGDVLYDLGCGDGRIVVTAAKRHGVKAVGIDIDPQRIKEAREKVREGGVGDLVTIKQADLFKEDLTGASVVTLYLLPELNVRLMPRLKGLKTGTRIVSHDFDMKGAKPTKVVTVRADGDGREHTVYLWVVPWEDERP